MSQEAAGSWLIESVVVNSETVNDDGFKNIQISGNQIVIQPLDLRFKIEEATTSGMLLRSDEDDQYFATVRYAGNKFRLLFTRAGVPERVELTAKLDDFAVTTKTREVVQV